MTDIVDTVTDLLVDAETNSLTFVRNHGFSETKGPQLYQRKPNGWVPLFEKTDATGLVGLVEDSVIVGSWLESTVKNQPDIPFNVGSIITFDYYEDDASDPVQVCKWFSVRQVVKEFLVATKTFLIESKDYPAFLAFLEEQGYAKKLQTLVWAFPEESVSNEYAIVVSDNQ